MRQILMAFSFLCLFFVQAQESKSVLFLGNSYIYSNNLPEMVKNMATSTGDTFNYYSNSPGGYTLQQHSNNATSLNKIAEGNWDFVVLQEQSQMPSFPLNYVQQQVFPYAQALNTAIKTANVCTQTVFYMTWGRKNGDAQNCPNWPPVCTYEGMDDLLQERYGMMADQNQALLAPVAVVWRALRAQHPSIELYSSDGSHPSVAGTYAAACTFYTVFYRKNPEAISYLGNLDDTTAQTIRSIVKSEVFENMEEWHVGEYDPKADFEHQLIGNLEFQFQNTSSQANAYWWDFGDGNHSTEENPIHQYTQNGTYTVQLKAEQCGIESWMSKTISTDGMAVSDNEQTELMIYPNPATTLLNLEIRQANSSEYQIFNSNGEVVTKGKLTQKINQLDISQLEKGVYYIQLNGKKHPLKFVKK